MKVINNIIKLLIISVLLTTLSCQTSSGGQGELNLIGEWTGQIKFEGLSKEKEEILGSVLGDGFNLTFIDEKKLKLTAFGEEAESEYVFDKTNQLIEFNAGGEDIKVKIKGDKLEMDTGGDGFIVVLTKK